jgi:hypothetical protein
VSTLGMTVTAACTPSLEQIFIISTVPLGTEPFRIRMLYATKSGLEIRHVDIMAACTASTSAVRSTRNDSAVVLPCRNVLGSLSTMIQLSDTSLQNV